MPIQVPKRVSGGAPEGSRLLNRAARPLNGLEIAEAIKVHLLEIARQLMSSASIKTEKAEDLSNSITSLVSERVSQQTRLQKVHICYPKVGWSLRVNLERLDDAGLDHHLNAVCELDLERNVRLILHFGEAGKGELVSWLEDERLSTETPDEIREQFQIPIELEYMKPDGTTGKASLNDLRSSKPDRRSARTVDVGSAKIEGQEVKLGETIVTPDELPEITLDEVGGLVAEPPKVETRTSQIPQAPVGGMGKTNRPNVKLKSKETK